MNDEKKKLIREILAIVLGVGVFMAAYLLAALVAVWLGGVPDVYRTGP